MAGTASPPVGSTGAKAITDASLVVLPENDSRKETLNTVFDEQLT